MLLKIGWDRASSALHEPSKSMSVWLAAWSTPGRLRAALASAAVFGVVAFVLGAGNRLTRGPWFLYAPEVSIIPPIGRAAWQHAFALHQQSPLYALCGGYNVGGMQSITIYRFLYWWEWWRIASAVLLVASLLAAMLIYLARTARAPQSSDLLRWLGLLAAAVIYFVLRYFADHAGLFATINLGQQRHALDITFASVGVAMLIVAAIAPAGVPGEPVLPRVASRMSSRVTWGSFIAINIAFGALFEALDAGPLWTSFPGYADAILPAPDRLFAFNPVWRNLTENGYFVQASHRVLSIGLWAVALLTITIAAFRRLPLARVVVLFGLLTLEGVLGVATLQPDAPVVLSIIHEACAIAVLAAALMPYNRAALATMQRTGS
jgi:cytochrome c oxidase assembly protein subunit 15